MLARVAGAEDASAIFFHATQECLHLLRAELAGFIDDHHSPVEHGFPNEEFADRLRACETRCFQVNHLLALWRDDVNRVARAFETALDLTQREALAGASSPTKQRQEIR